MKNESHRWKENVKPIMNNKLARIAIVLLSSIPATLAADVTNLRCEYRDNPLGIDAEKPRLSWVIEERSQRSEDRGQKQSAYQVLVASSEKLLKKDKGDLWDSGKVASDQSIQVEYAGQPLVSGQQCFWKVKVWTLTSDRRPLTSSAWSAPAGWSMGLLKPEDWKAKWVKPGGDTSPWLRKEFTLTAAPERATAFVNVRGYYELYVNGKKVSDDVLVPAVSVYKKRSLYNTYDISKYLRPGTNCVGVWLGLGLVFRGDIAPLARVQLDMSVGGRREVVGTDTTWTWTSSTHTEFRWGWCDNGVEQIDMRRDIPGWSEPGCLSGKWAPVEECANPSAVASAQSCPPNRIIKTFPVVSCTALTTNVWELDFGTNMTGWLKLRLPKLEAGQQLTVRFADKRLASAKEEVTPVKTYELAPGSWKLDTPRGPIAYTVYNQKVVFTSAGKPGEVFCNKFNYEGFRYAIVAGLPGKPADGDAEALMIDSDIEPAGSFECSNDLLNRIMELNAWTVRCLTLGGYSFDCPHRERMGYGDGQVSVDMQMMSRNVAAFYTKSAVDWLDDQDVETGKSAQFVPKNIDDPSCWFSWGGLLDVLPWKSYLYFGDRRLLERAYEQMVRYPSVYIESFYKDGVHRTGGDPGCDWVAPAHGMSAPPGTELFANCYRVYLYDLLAKSAEALGRTDDALRHRAKIAELKPLIHAAYYRPDEKLYVVDEQLNQAMPLMLGIVPEELRRVIEKKLEEITLVKNKGHLDTGSLGTYFLFQHLKESGRSDLAFTIATQKDFPGWGYMLAQGATTMWEQWDGYWSQIHSCYTYPGEWMYQGLAGIRPDETGPGFKKIIIKPAIVGDVTWVRCSYDSIHGKIVSNWKRDGDPSTGLRAGKLTMDVAIPINTTATVYVPAKDADSVTESGKPIAEVKGVKFLRMENGAAVYEVGSGTYRFQSTLPAGNAALAAQQASGNGGSVYPDGRPSASLRMEAKDQGVVLKHGDGPGKCDILGAREALIFEGKGIYHLFYDGAGPKGWLACLATSKDLKVWEKKGPMLDFGKPGESDSAAACSPWVYFDGKEWHMFYLGTPNVSGPPDLVPSCPYLTLKAKSRSLAGPWVKQPDVIPFLINPGTYYAVTASPGHIVKKGDEYLMFFSASMKRTLGIARTRDLNGPWAIDPQPIVSPEEQIENSSLYFEPTIKTWFLFTNHIGLDGDEYTDAVWVYWSRDLNSWDAKNKAVVLDGKNCAWSRKCIGMPSVVKVGKRLGIFYDAPGGDSTSHMHRDIGLAWLDLPLTPPVNNIKE